jgi:hypothetical protein
MLQRVEAEIYLARRIRMAMDGYNAALLAKLVVFPSPPAARA